MTDVNLSGATKALLKAARADAPSAATRAKVWTGVSNTVGGAVGAAGSTAASGGVGSGVSSGLATSATVGGVSAAKMLVVGTLLGGAVTVGLGATMLRIGPSPNEVRPAAHVVVAAATAANARAMPVQSPTRMPSLAATATPSPTSSAATSGTNWSASSNATSSSNATEAATAIPRPVAQRPQAPPVDALAREASLVSDARRALARGDARTALILVRKARAVPSPQLVPEELAVESHALRALGHDDEATGVDFTLKTQYPDSALAR